MMKGFLAVLIICIFFCDGAYAQTEITELHRGKLSQGTLETIEAESVNTGEASSNINSQKSNSKNELKQVYLHQETHKMFKLGLYHFWGTKASFDKVKLRSNGGSASGDSEVYLEPTWGIDLEVIPYSNAEMNLIFGLQYDFKQTMKSTFINLNGVSAASMSEDGETFENLIVYSNGVLNLSNNNQLYAGLNYSFPTFTSATVADIQGGFGFQCGLIFKISEKISGDFGWRMTSVEVRYEEDDPGGGVNYLDMGEGSIYGFKLGFKYSF